jgi:hypothetical protein
MSRPVPLAVADWVGTMVPAVSLEADYDGVTNENSAFAAALTSASSIGGTLFLRPGTLLISPNHEIPVGVSIFGSPGSKIKFAADGAHGFKPQGNNRFDGFHMEGPGTDASFDGFGLFRLLNVSNIWISNIRGSAWSGDGIRNEDASYVWVTNTRWDVSRNVITINDDATGSHHHWYNGISGTSYFAGFLAESDDSLYAVNDIYLSDFEFTANNAGSNAGMGVGFTKSPTTNAGTFKKYNRIYTARGSVTGFENAYVARGGQDIQFLDCNGFNCDQAGEFGNGNPVHNLTVRGGRFDCNESGFRVLSPAAGDSTDITIEGTKVVVDTASATKWGAYLDANGFRFAGNVIDMNGGTTSFGLITEPGCNNGVVIGNTVIDAISEAYRLAGSTAGAILADGNIVDGRTVTTAIGFGVTGTSPNVQIGSGNQFLGTVTTRFSGTPGLWGSATFNPADLVDGAGETTTVAVVGAALGDFAEASFSLDLQGITLTAWVSATDVVSVRFQNETTGSVNLASGTLRARVRKS